MPEPKKISGILHSQDDESSKEQTDRDRSMREKRVRSRTNYKKLKLKRFARQLINDLTNYGPLGIIHMEALSNIIKKPIHIWQGNNLYSVINSQTNKSNIERPVNVEYHLTNQEDVGHWTLPGNRDPAGIEKELNSCLFTVIGYQTNRSAADLRTSVVDYLTNNIKTLTDNIDELLPSTGKNATPLMIGGARYDGSISARAILDNSQNADCYNCKRAVGHPRGHASEKYITGWNDSVENYSRSSGDMKSGFLSREDQDEVAHYALIHAKSKNAMKCLNNGSWNEAVTLTAEELESKGCCLPKMKEWFNGEEFSEELDIIRVTLVLRHHIDKENDPEAEVFVHTFYPQKN